MASETIELPVVDGHPRCAGGTRRAVPAGLPGCQVVPESAGGVDVARRVLAGEAVDVVVLAAKAIDELIRAGRLVADSRVDMVKSGIAIAVRAGAYAPGHLFAGGREKGRAGHADTPATPPVRAVCTWRRCLRAGACSNRSGGTVGRHRRGCLWAAWSRGAMWRSGSSS